jgi:hypothetical protein
MRSFTQTGVLVVLLTVTAMCACAKRPSPVGISEPTQRSADGRTVIRSGSLELHARDLPHVKSEVERLVAEKRGWVDSWSLTDNRVLRMTLRVPEPTLEDTMEVVSSLGRVISRSLSSQDVTEEMIDLEARLSNLRALRDRLREYLNRAAELKDILEVERELTRVQTEIESIEARLKILKSKVAMSELKLWAKRKRV